mgnify:CR=1 FL=1|jgi:hypothetical protein
MSAPEQLTAGIIVERRKIYNKVDRGYIGS